MKRVLRKSQFMIVRMTLLLDVTKDIKKTQMQLTISQKR